MVVVSREFSSNGICKKPELASSLVKILLFFSLAMVGAVSKISSSALQPESPRFDPGSAKI